MDKYDEYQHQAEEARQMADRAITPQDRAAWLSIAAGWLELINQRPDGLDEITSFGTKKVNYLHR